MLPKISEEISALRLGARGYSKKTIGPALLKKAVIVIQRGEFWDGEESLSSPARRSSDYCEKAGSVL